MRARTNEVNRVPIAFEEDDEDHDDEEDALK